MEKIKINGTEIEFDKDRVKQLSDDELETVSGGMQPIETMHFYSWFCNTCHAEGATSLSYDAAFKETMKAHKTATGHCEFTAVSAVYRDGFYVNGVWTETV